MAYRQQPVRAKHVNKPKRNDKSQNTTKLKTTNHKTQQQN